MAFRTDGVQGTGGHTCQGASLLLMAVLLGAHQTLHCRLMQPYCVYTGSLTVVYGSPTVPTHPGFVLSFCVVLLCVYRAQSALLIMLALLCVCRLATETSMK